MRTRRMLLTEPSGKKFKAAYAGPLIEADKEKIKATSVLPEDYQDIVEGFKFRCSR